MRVKYTGAACQDAGERHNEDTYLIREFKGQDRRIFFYAVADGVGGLGHGDLASNYTTKKLDAWFEKKKDWLTENHPASDLTMSLYDEILYINDALLDECAEKGVESGSTLTAALIYKREYIILHVGDSRAYLFEDGKCRLLTKDQTRAQQERDRGVPEDLISPQMERTVLQCMGSGVIRPEVYTGELQVNFQMLLCSDGLSNRLTEEEIAYFCAQDLLGENKLQQMIQLVRSRGEKDNITGILLERCREVGAC